MEAKPAALPVDAVDLAAALVMTRPVDQRMAAFVDVARVYHRMLANRPGATQLQIREQARAFGLTLLHRLQGAVLADVDAWIEE